jgi:pyridoxal phosphate enzyme (YggS family)
MSQLKSNLEKIQSLLKPEVNLLAISKTKPVEMIKELYTYGVTDFGENKVQDLLSKSNELADLDINWHFVGHLQTNKINQILKVKNLVAIHSVDSEDLLNKILKKDTRMPIGLFLQINTSEEDEKSGFAMDTDFTDMILSIKNSSSFDLQGLMTMGRIRTDEFEADAKKCFIALNKVKEKLDKDHYLDLELSMGMSQDFEIAQDFGTNWVRIGSSLFGARD